MDDQGDRPHGFAALVAVVAVVMAGVAGWRAASGLKDWLYVLAGGAEAVGVLWIAAPELEPRFTRGVRATSRLLGASLRRFWGWVRVTILRRDPPGLTLSASAGDAVAGGDSASVRVSVGAGRTVEERIDFLMRRDQEVQGALEDINQRLAAEPWQPPLREAIEMLRQSNDAAVTRAAERHIGVRLLGIVLLVVGIALGTWANLTG